MRDAGSIRFTLEFIVGPGRVESFRSLANDLLSVVAAHEPRARVDKTRWVADSHARRVPTFVIRMTGLDTKKKVVARYGADAVFEKGRPAPRARPSAVGG
jgi:hypothetical protein